MKGQNISGKPAVFNMLGEAFKAFFKKIHVVLFLIVVGGGLSLALTYVFWSLFGYGGANGEVVLRVLYVILNGAVNLVFGLAIMKVMLDTMQGKEVGFESLLYGVKNLWGGFVVDVRMFIYVFLWPMLVLVGVLIAFTILNIISRVGVGATAFGAALGDYSSQGGVSVAAGYSLRQMIFASGNMFLGLLGMIAVLAVFGFALVRGPKVMFSVYAYVNEGKKSKEALEYSKDLVKGNWWTVVWKAFAAMLLLMLVLVVITFVGAIIVGGDFSFAVGTEQLSENSSLLENIGHQFIATAFGAFAMTYISQLYLKMKAYKGM